MAHAQGAADSSSTTMRGAFIVFEGIDRSGKTTQAKMLAEALQKDGVSTRSYRFPDRTTPIGQLINTYLTNADMSFPHEVCNLLFAANRWELIDSIKETLLKGDTVVVDRYSFSGIAYSVGALDLDYQYSAASEAGLLEPDVVFYLETPTELAAQRGGFGDERYELTGTQRKISEVYEMRFADESYWHKIDGGRTPSDVHSDILAAAKMLLTSLSTPTPLRTLNLTSKTQ